ncbi:uncharacterized protein LOC132451141 [Gadus macrocephalus]|uniref:uncharacterized protein LOC132451141 n=1 Tax=Gadus macrocephalus TaxID=80720 RepID=UPI0028CB4BC2|nr:uncharacterized protein LOC132451141 [Gadus macrocephalus]
MPLLSRRLRALPRKHSKKTPYSITRVMAGYQRCISLALVGLLLCHNFLAESTACTSREKGFAHCIFLCRHFPHGAPQTANLKKWKDFLGDPDPNRRIQSFLKPSDLGRVNAVCTDEGGRQCTQPANPNDKRQNLCISRQPFKYLTVVSDYAGYPYMVTEENKHLILACDKVDNICLPTHFEPNRDRNQNANVCRGKTKPKINV